MTVVELSVTGQQETDLAKRKAKKLLYIITKSSWKNNRSDQLKAYKVPTESVVLQGVGFSLPLFTSYSESKEGRD